MSRDRIFPTRFTQQELNKLKVEAKLKGMSVGQLIRFRALGQERSLEGRIAALESQTPGGDRAAS